MIAIGLRLEQRISNRQNLARCLYRCICFEADNRELCRICDEVIEKYGHKISKAIGLTDKRTYHLARQVYFRGIPELIERLDRQQIPFSKAKEIANMPKDLQGKHLQTIEIQ